MTKPFYQPIVYFNGDKYGVTGTPVRYQTIYPTQDQALKKAQQIMKEQNGTACAYGELLAVMD